MRKRGRANVRPVYATDGGFAALTLAAARRTFTVQIGVGRGAKIESHEIGFESWCGGARRIAIDEDVRTHGDAALLVPHEQLVFALQRADETLCRSALEHEHVA